MANDDGEFNTREGMDENDESGDSYFDLAETDLNEDELDLNMSRKMSIRALNVTTMNRFSPYYENIFSQQPHQNTNS